MAPILRRLPAGVATVLLVLASTHAVNAQDLPACEGTAGVADCILPTWPDEQQLEAPSPFGEIDGTAWLVDAIGDGPAVGLDIRAVGLGSVDIADPAAVRGMPGLLKAGKVKQAVRPGRNLVVRVVLDRPLSEVVDGHAGIHVVTDIDRSRSNNAPAGVGEGEQLLAGSEDVYSVTYATTTGQTRLLDSDLSAGWYSDKDAFAAAWAAPDVLDILVRPEGVGDGIRVMSFTSGADGGYDGVDLGTGAIPIDGRVGLRPACLEATISGEPFVVSRLVESGQTLRNVEAPSSWRGGASFHVDAATRQGLEALVARLDDDGDGSVALGAAVFLFEDGAVIGQRPEVSLALDGNQAQLGLELGLTRRGYEVVRAIDLEPTGLAEADAWLSLATDALLEAMPPFRSGRRAGALFGAGEGTCVAALSPDA